MYVDLLISGRVFEGQVMAKKMFAETFGPWTFHIDAWGRPNRIGESALRFILELRVGTGSEDFLPHLRSAAQALRERVAGLLAQELDAASRGELMNLVRGREELALARAECSRLADELAAAQAERKSAESHDAVVGMAALRHLNANVQRVRDELTEGERLRDLVAASVARLEASLAPARSDLLERVARRVLAEMNERRAAAEARLSACGDAIAELAAYRQNKPLIDGILTRELDAALRPQPAA